MLMYVMHKIARQKMFVTTSDPTRPADGPDPCPTLVEADMGQHQEPSDAPPRPGMSTLVSGRGRTLSQVGILRKYADIRGGSSWRGPQAWVRLSTTAIFVDLSGNFFGNFRYGASTITCRYATPCRPV